MDSSIETEKARVGANVALAAGTTEDKLTKKILFKLDWRVLPIVSLLFLCAFLDRSNVGNARILGLEKDLHLTNRHYEQGLAIFFVTYIVSEVPCNLLLKKVTPRIWLPSLTCAWGIITMCLGFVRGHGSFLAVRALLGIAEAGLGPGIILYLSHLYTRSEMALRIGIFYTAASVSGAFGGLLARGLNEVGPRGGLEGWRWILIIEGLITVVCAGIAYLGLPNGLSSASFLTPEERAFAQDRLLLDKPGVTRNADGNITINTEEEERFQWSEVRRGFLNVQVWLTSLAYIALLTGVYSFSLFLPTIINDTGFAADANQVQLWSVIPYVSAAVLTVIVAFLSDRLRLRGVLILFALPLAIIGYAAIANIKRPVAKYGMTFLMAAGIYSSVPCLLAWNSNNSAGHYKRATTSALQLAIANCGGFIATFIYPTAHRPQYHQGHTIVLSLLVFAWFMVLLNVLNCMRINRNKANGKYAEFAGCGDDRDPEFLMIL